MFVQKSTSEEKNNVNLNKFFRKDLRNFRLADLDLEI